MANIYFSSDIHIGHKLVAELRGFDNPQDHDDWLFEKWNSVLKKDDQLWILGDIALSSYSDALGWIDKLPGVKQLVLGNHDAPFPKNRDAHKHFKRFMHVFESVQLHAVRKIAGQKVFLSHFPFAKDGDGPDRPGCRYPEWRVQKTEDIKLLIHGHIHNRQKINVDNDSLHIGPDAWNGDLVPLDTIAQWVQQHN